MTSKFSSVLGVFRGGRLSGHASRRSKPRSLRVEPLEDRRLLTISFTNGPGAGTVNIENIDAYGAFGSRVFQPPAPGVESLPGNAIYDPVNAVPAGGTVLESGLAIGFISDNPNVPSVPREFLTAGDIHQSGGLDDLAIVERTSGDVKIAESDFTYQELEFRLTQYLIPVYDRLNSAQRTGTLLSQVYDITNPTDTTIKFDLFRYWNPDLRWNTTSGQGTFDDDGGGMVLFVDLIELGEIEVLFATNETTDAPEQDVYDDPTIIGIMAEGGKQNTESRYEVSEEWWTDPLEFPHDGPDVVIDAIFPGPDASRSLTNDVLRDGDDADHTVDFGRGYDVSMALYNFFELQAGATERYYTSTIFGTLLPGSGSYIPAKAALSGTVWNDANGDGIRGVDDTGIAGETVFIDENGNGVFDSGEKSAVTGGSGLYTIDGLDAGTYDVLPLLKADFVQTMPVGPASVTIDLGSTLTDVDFGIHFEGATITGMKWGDMNGNAVLDPGETGLSGFTIFADLNNDGVLQNTEPAEVTADDGTYTLFISPGTYTIAEVQQPNWGQTFPAGSGTHTVIVGPDDVATDINFGNDPAPGSVSGIVWDDDNESATLDVGEIGLPGITVYLDMNQNGTLDADEPSDVSDVDGMYEIADVDPGTFRMAVDVPPNYEITFPATRAYTVEIVPGVSLSGYDFGIRLQDGALSGVVFNDLNANGLREDDEPGVPNLIIYVDLDGNGQIGLGEPAAITLPDGSYRMPKLRPGNRIVREVITPGWIPTNPANGAQPVVVEPSREVRDVSFGNREMRDYGDAPAPYPSAKRDNGPVHGVLLDFYLGRVPADGETDALISADATGDDATEMDDDDGILFQSLLIPGETVYVTATTSKDNGILQGWIDFNADGDWDDPNEQVFTDLWLAGGANSLRFDVPPNAELGQTFARFRYGYERGISYVGKALAGEVEDYMLEIGVPDGGGLGGGEGEFNPWQNPNNVLDVNNDSYISPIDALMIINDLNITGAKRLSGTPVPTARTSFVDVSGDRFITAIDALRVINALNIGRLAEGEQAEGEAPSDPAALAISLDTVYPTKDRFSRTDGRPRPQAGRIDAQMAQTRRHAGWQDGDRTVSNRWIERIAQSMARRAARRRDAAEATDAALDDVLPPITPE